jgi:hypothetical protein
MDWWGAGVNVSLSRLCYKSTHGPVLPVDAGMHACMHTHTPTCVRCCSLAYLSLSASF